MIMLILPVFAEKDIEKIPFLSILRPIAFNWDEGGE